MNDIYEAVAKNFVERINAIFDTEATLKAEFERNFEGLEFSRTDHWSTIVYRIMRDAWFEKGPEVKGEPTSYDKLVILRLAHPLLDYNLFTQVLLNLQGYTGMAYIADAKTETERLRERWEFKTSKLDPFAAKAKMVKIAVAPDEVTHNSVLSALRSLKIISEFSPQISFRVSPKGSTPAFADSRNVSMLGIGADEYLRTWPSLRPFYITWSITPRMCVHTMNRLEPGKIGVQAMFFVAPGIPYDFVSKSGGEILNEVLFARYLMHRIFGAVDTTQEMCTMIPRLNSLLVVTTEDGKSLEQAFGPLKEKYPMLELVAGQRNFLNDNA